MQFLSVMRVMHLRAIALRDTMALHVNISTPVHVPHASTIPHVQMSQALSTSVFVNQDIQVRTMLKSQLVIFHHLNLNLNLFTFHKS
jgi:hypothetical protein